MWQWYGKESELGVAKLDLSVMMEDGGGELRGGFNYATALFDKETMQSYVETYQVILGQMRQDRFIDPIVAERRLKAFETLVSQQTPEVHDGSLLRFLRSNTEPKLLWDHRFSLCGTGKLSAVTHVNLFTLPDLHRQISVFNPTFVEHRCRQGVGPLTRSQQ